MNAYFNDKYTGRELEIKFDESTMVARLIIDGDEIIEGQFGGSQYSDFEILDAEDDSQFEEGFAPEVGKLIGLLNSPDLDVERASR